MSDEQEVAHFDNYIAGEKPPLPAWILDTHLGQDANECFQRIREVVQLVISTPRDRWPADVQWQQLLPSWFLYNTPIISREQAEIELATTPREQWHLLTWDFGSWLDAIYNRGWCWWSCLRIDQRLTIYLVLEEWPASLEAFEHNLQAAGATIEHSGPGPTG